ncbi:MAG TPA: hypothetical protein VM409_08460 [Chloroflexia bacterium]|nr:hypothetical protein [Chloroflexia bacterium]
MGGYFDRGSTAGGDETGYFDRDQTGRTDSVKTGEGPPGVQKDDIAYDSDNPNIARATTGTNRLDETAGVTTNARIQGSYPDIVEGSDSERTGTSWGVPGVDENAQDEIASGTAQEGEQSGQAHPNRNTGARLSRDELKDVGSWSTIDKGDSAGSPTGNS